MQHHTPSPWDSAAGDNPSQPALPQMDATSPQGLSRVSHDSRACISASQGGNLSRPPVEIGW